MCEMMPVTDLVNMPINWVRGDDERLRTIFRSLKDGACVNKPIRLLRCGCGKTYMLEDGGHRITAAYKLYQETRREVLLPVDIYTADFQ